MGRRSKHTNRSASRRTKQSSADSRHGLPAMNSSRARTTRPIRAITDIMRRLADGDATVAIPGTARRDEIGDMAAAVEVFKENAIERQRLAGESLAAKQRAGDQRKIEMRKIAAQFEGAVGRIVKAVSSSVDELHAVAGTLVEAARTTQKLAENAARASEDASKNVL